jgi:hypothetical protein
LRPSYSIFVPNSAIESTEDTFSISSIKEGRVNLGGYNYVFRAPTRFENTSWVENLLRIADQFRAIPLLDTIENGFVSSAPLHRDLPPLPSSILPLAPTEHGQVQGQGQEGQEGQRGPIGAIAAGSSGTGPPGTQQLNAVHEEQEEVEGNVSPKAQNATPGATGATAGLGQSDGVATGTSGANNNIRGDGAPGTGLGTASSADHGRDGTSKANGLTGNTGGEEERHTHAPLGNEPGMADDIHDGSADKWHSVHENQDFGETGSKTGEDDEVSSAQQGLHDAYAPVSNPLAKNVKQGEAAAI